ncbi:hypothetical protein A9264_09415 [Vibrio sp. UCD-FRSSP16_10]|uniref:DUF4381 domain-containing protein n=1 Tax=unclassified Vibrio TaxID=2614977 RepID=UPI0007FF94CF|nr:MULTISPECIES: DUF4381 domain-containing protein [unclassified Vibrio]OBT16939.1 hypothetical protein A9260_09640 [Vibrio sp. UCD-FRSSP16_30]OBT21930.1 hypothetical protein A9264_09415 [Vibrio sp. UCD-FRSSP16_10]
MSQIQQQTHALPLKPIHLPADPSAWPLAWGYWGILGAICVVLVIIFITHRSIRNKQKAKKAALQILAKNASHFSVSETQELLRQAALSYFPRQDIAKLTGDKWLSFLDSQLASPRFLAKSDLWKKALYAAGKSSDHTNAELIEDCQHWLNNALPPKRKYRNWNAS